MDELVLQRAEMLMQLTKRHLLHEDSSDFSMGEGYRFAILLLRGPREFRRLFECGELRLDADALDDLYWRLRLEIPGPSNLMDEERGVIRDHNIAVDELLGAEEVYPLQQLSTVHLLRTDHRQ
jgi:hypothetical protein